MVQGVAVGALLTTAWIHSDMPLQAAEAVNEHSVEVTAGAFSGIVALIAGAWVAWLTLFRQMRIGRTPKDSASRVALTCPRCGHAQSVAVGEDQCSECRLQIFITLDEGACRRCGYPLRGLTSERCPECGTAIGGDENGANDEQVSTKSV